MALMFSALYDESAHMIRASDALVRIGITIPPYAPLAQDRELRLHIEVVTFWRSFDSDGINSLGIRLV